jgi:hypothetical protein
MELKEALGAIYKKAREQFDIQNVPKLHLKQDEENAQDLLGKTAYYEPSDMSIVLYTLQTDTPKTFVDLLHTN